MDERLVPAFKQFVIDNKVGKGLAQKLVGLHNKIIGENNAAYKEQLETDDKQTASDRLAKVKACDDTLIAHTDFGTAEKLKESDILLHKALLNNVDITAEEAGGLSEFMRDGEPSTNPVLRRVMLKLLAPLAAESGMHGPGGGNTPEAPVDPDEGSPSHHAAGWSTPEQVAAYNARNK